MNYKLICVDMDGTLLSSKKEISKKTLKSIKEAHDKGVKLVVATGRIFVSASYYGDIIGVKAPIIASNGAYVREKDKEIPIYEEYLSKEECRVILSILEKYEIIPHFYSTDTIYSGKLAYSSLAYKNANKNLPPHRQVNIEIINNWKGFLSGSPKVIKAMAMDADEEKIKRAKAEFIELDRFEVVSSLDSSFEVMVKGTSKGNAVRKLCEYYKIPREQVIAIGDNENDISMIEYAGLGVAMGNAEESVKNIANYITLSNDEDGVCRVIEKFILNSF